MVWLAWKCWAYQKYSDDEFASALPCLLFPFSFINLTELSLEHGHMWESPGGWGLTGLRSPENRREESWAWKSNFLFHSSWMDIFFLKKCSIFAEL